MLAGERQLRTGIALSFAAALAQSLTAIIFIVVAAAILRMSSVAMNGGRRLDRDPVLCPDRVCSGSGCWCGAFSATDMITATIMTATITMTMGTITNMRMKATPIIMSSCPKRVRTCARRSAWCWRSVSGPVPVP